VPLKRSSVGKQVREIRTDLAQQSYNTAIVPFSSGSASMLLGGGLHHCAGITDALQNNIPWYNRIRMHRRLLEPQAALNIPAARSSHKASWKGHDYARVAVYHLL
jgi:hypothetical protein